MTARPPTFIGAPAGSTAVRLPIDQILSETPSQRAAGLRLADTILDNFNRSRGFGRFAPGNTSSKPNPIDAKLTKIADRLKGIGNALDHQAASARLDAINAQLMAAARRL